MPFNSITYRANRYRKSAAENIKKARDIKARQAIGDAYDWEIPRIAIFAKLAILDARMARGYERLRKL